VAKRRADDLRSDDEYLQERMDRLTRKDPGPEACWHWVGYRHPGHGYGRVQFMGSLRNAHLESLRLAGRTLPPGYVWRRACENEDCIRPEHWQPTTKRELAQTTPIMAARLARTACPQGHPYTPENTYRTKQGHRKCRECQRIHDRQPERARDRHVARLKKSPSGSASALRNS
jgi:hypothetical protein